MFRLMHYRMLGKILAGFGLSVILFTAVPFVAQAQFEGVQSGSSSTAPTVNPTTDQDAADGNKFIPEINIPGQFSGAQDIDNDLFGRYVRAIYIYFIWTVGVIATGMVVYAGVKWVAAAGNQSRIKDARDMINNAIIGVIIALTSVVLLNLLSPGFTTLSIPSITTVKKDYFTGAAATDFCGIAEEINCGQLKEEGGTVVDPNGREVKEYCLGTLCDKGKVCSLTTKSYPGYQATGSDFTTPFVVYAPAGGCVTTVPLAANRPTAYAGIDGLVLSEILQCGQINNNKKLLGSSCNESIATRESSCYVATTPGIVVERSNGDILKDMHCPTN